MLVQFVVREDGAPDLSTLKILKSSHDLFTNAVRISLATMRMRPARVGGRAVKQLVQMPFEFRLAARRRSAQRARRRAPIHHRQSTRNGLPSSRSAASDGPTSVRRQHGAPRLSGRTSSVAAADQLRATLPRRAAEAPASRAKSSRNSSSTRPAEPVMSTFRVVKSSHDLFSVAVRNALPSMRFHPAEVGGHPMKQLVTMPFEFSLAKRAAAACRATTAGRRRVRARSSTTVPRARPGRGPTISPGLGVVDSYPDYRRPALLARRLSPHSSWPNRPPTRRSHMPVRCRCRPPIVFSPLLLLLFVGSGCAALIYEIVWFQLLQLVIGSSAVSLGVLLGTFMGGMCLGSLLLPRFVTPERHPLRIYALLEAGIGVLGLVVLSSSRSWAASTRRRPCTGWPGFCWRGVAVRGRACCRRRC